MSAEVEKSSSSSSPPVGAHTQRPEVVLSDPSVVLNDQYPTGPLHAVFAEDDDGDGGEQSTTASGSVADDQLAGWVDRTLSEKYAFKWHEEYPAEYDYIHDDIERRLDPAVIKKLLDKYPDMEVFMQSRFHPLPVSKKPISASLPLLIPADRTKIVEMSEDDLKDALEYRTASALPEDDIARRRTKPVTEPVGLQIPRDELPPIELLQCSLWWDDIFNLRTYIDVLRRKFKLPTLTLCVYGFDESDVVHRTYFNQYALVEMPTYHTIIDEKTRGGRWNVSYIRSDAPRAKLVYNPSTLVTGDHVLAIVLNKHGLYELSQHLATAKKNYDKDKALHEMDAKFDSDALKVDHATQLTGMYGWPELKNVLVCTKTFDHATPFYGHHNALAVATRAEKIVGLLNKYKLREMLPKKYYNREANPADIFDSPFVVDMSSDEYMVGLNPFAVDVAGSVASGSDKRRVGNDFLAKMGVSPIQRPHAPGTTRTILKSWGDRRIELLASEADIARPLEEVESDEEWPSESSEEISDSTDEEEEEEEEEESGAGSDDDDEEDGVGDIQVSIEAEPTAGSANPPTTVAKPAKKGGRAKKAKAAAAAATTTTPTPESTVLDVPGALTYTLEIPPQMGADTVIYSHNALNQVLQKKRQMGATAAAAAAAYRSPTAEQLYAELKQNLAAMAERYSLVPRLLEENILTPLVDVRARDGTPIYSADDLQRFRAVFTDKDHLTLDIFGTETTSAKGLDAVLKPDSSFATQNTLDISVDGIKIVYRAVARAVPLEMYGAPAWMSFRVSGNATAGKSRSSNKNKRLLDEGEERIYQSVRESLLQRLKFHDPSHEALPQFRKENGGGGNSERADALMGRAQTLLSHLQQMGVTRDKFGLLLCDDKFRMADTIKYAQFYNLARYYLLAQMDAEAGNALYNTHTIPVVGVYRDFTPDLIKTPFWAGMYNVPVFGSVAEARQARFEDKVQHSMFVLDETGALLDDPHAPLSSAAIKLHQHGTAGASTAYLSKENWVYRRFEIDDTRALYVYVSPKAVQDLPAYTSNAQWQQLRRKMAEEYFKMTLTMTKNFEVLVPLDAHKYTIEQGMLLLEQTKKKEEDGMESASAEEETKKRVKIGAQLNFAQFDRRIRETYREWNDSVFPRHDSFAISTELETPVRNLLEVLVRHGFTTMARYCYYKNDLLYTIAFHNIHWALRNPELKRGIERQLSNPLMQLFYSGILHAMNLIYPYFSADDKITFTPTSREKGRKLFGRQSLLRILDDPTTNLHSLRDAHILYRWRRVDATSVCHIVESNDADEDGVVIAELKQLEQFLAKSDKRDRKKLAVRRNNYVLLYYPEAETVDSRGTADGSMPEHSVRMRALTYLTHKERGWQLMRQTANFQLFMRQWKFGPTTLLRESIGKGIALNYLPTILRFRYVRNAYDVWLERNWGRNIAEHIWEPASQIVSSASMSIVSAGTKQTKFLRGKIVDDKALKLTVDLRKEVYSLIRDIVLILTNTRPTPVVCKLYKSNGVSQIEIPFVFPDTIELVPSRLVGSIYNGAVRARQIVYDSVAAEQVGAFLKNAMQSTRVRKLSVTELLLRDIDTDDDDDDDEVSEYDLDKYREERRMRRIRRQANGGDGDEDDTDSEGDDDTSEESSHVDDYMFAPGVTNLVTTDEMRAPQFMLILETTADWPAFWDQFAPLLKNKIMQFSLLFVMLGDDEEILATLDKHLRSVYDDNVYRIKGITHRTLVGFALGELAMSLTMGEELARGFDPSYDTVRTKPLRSKDAIQVLLEKDGTNHFLKSIEQVRLEFNEFFDPDGRKQTGVTEIKPSIAKRKRTDDATDAPETKRKRTMAAALAPTPMDVDRQQQQQQQVSVGIVDVPDGDTVLLDTRTGVAITMSATPETPDTVPVRIEPLPASTAAAVVAAEDDLAAELNAELMIDDDDSTSTDRHRAGGRNMKRLRKADVPIEDDAKQKKTKKKKAKSTMPAFFEALSWVVRGIWPGERTALSVFNLHGVLEKINRKKKKKQEEENISLDSLASTFKKEVPYSDVIFIDDLSTEEAITRWAEQISEYPFNFLVALTSADAKVLLETVATKLAPTEADIWSTICVLLLTPSKADPELADITERFPRLNHVTKFDTFNSEARLNILYHMQHPGSESTRDYTTKLDPTEFMSASVAKLYNKFVAQAYFVAPAEFARFFKMGGIQAGFTAAQIAADAHTQ